jgi:anthranilate phosphoribosyltransferase
LLEGRDLSEPAMRRLLEDVIAGHCGDAETAALLVALRMKGETAEELAASARLLREHMVRLDTGRLDVLDTCGMGGDGSGTFNISTATALVVAGAGVPVVKHGNRAVSGHSGSADVLVALGVTVEGDVACARRCLDQAGLAFCFAPLFHPALHHVAAVRRRLRVRTLFNLVGPLINPGDASYQLLGVARPELLDPVAGALARLGTRRTLLVASLDGLDEVSLSSPTLVREIRGNRVSSAEWTAADFGLEPCDLADLHAAGPDESAAMIRSVLQGEDQPSLAVVLANAAAALVAAERVEDLKEGVARARDAVARGQARHVLERLVAASAEGL